MGIGVILQPVLPTQVQAKVADTNETGICALFMVERVHNCGDLQC